MRPYARSRVAVNATAASAQILLVSAAIFVGYSTAIRTSGTAALGIFSLMLSLSVLTQAASLGAAIGAPRHIAALIGSDRQPHLLGSVNLSIGLAVAGPLAAGVLLVGGFHLYAASMVVGTASQTVLALAPWVGVAAVLVPVSATLQGILDGLNKAPQRAFGAVIGASAYLTVAQLLIPRVGIVGLALATVAQHVATISILGVIAYRSLERRGRRWPEAETLRDHVKFNLRIQVLTLPTLAFDPAAKLFVAQGAGVAFVGVYEVASRLMQQVNVVLVAANQTLVPLLTFREARNELDRANSFRITFSSLAWLGLTSFGLVLAGVPILGAILLPDYQSSFVYASAALAVAWFANTLSGPGYFLAVALGHVRVNTVANYVTLSLIVVGGAAAHLSWGGFAMPLIIATAFTVNTTIINTKALRDSGLLPRDLVDRTNLIHAAASVAGCLVALSLWRAGTAPAAASFTGAALIMVSAALTFRFTRVALLLPTLGLSRKPPTERQRPE